MFLDDKPYTFDRVVRLGIAAALAWGFVWLLGYLSDVLIPFAIALLLAYLINPLVLFIQRKIPRRTPAVFLALFLVTAMFALLLLAVAPVIGREMANTGRLLKGLVGNSELAAQAADRLPPDLWQFIKGVAAREEVQQFFRNDNLWKLAETATRKLLPGLWGLIAGTASFFMGLVGLSLIGLYVVFLLLDFQKVREGWKELLLPAHREPLLHFAADFNLYMRRYFRGQAAVAGIVGALFALGFAIIGLPLGILLGLFIGLLNMVPYLQIIGVIPAVFLALVKALETGQSFPVTLGLVGLVFAVTQIIQDAVLVPRIMGKVTGLSPAVILLSLSVWGKLLGMLGLLIALPMTCLLAAYYRRFILMPPATGGTKSP